MKRKTAIICVDDEFIVLRALKSQLSGYLGKAHLIETVESGEEALELYDELIEEGYTIPLVISDQIMPGLKGDELLKRLYSIDPEIKSILLTGQASPEAVGSAVNEANLFRYISKPWEVEDLNLTVSEAINSFFQLKELQETERERKELLEQLKEANETLEQKVELRTKELQIEKQKSDDLLLNILPLEIAEELKEKGTSEPKHYDQATVLFTDFKGFTSVAAKTSPKELVATLNECFSAFDSIIERHNLEKIKTIGDAYMAAGGIPIENRSNAMDAVRAALEILKWIKDWNQKRKSEGLDEWPIRIGAHTGELVAGVIGSKKFAYDVWGDAVNIASRIESSSEPNKLNVSVSTYDLVKDHFNGDYRGEIEVKNRGPIGMYFIAPKT